MMKPTFMVLCAAGLLTGTPAFADDASSLADEQKRTERITARASDATLAERIAADFPDTFGTPEQTRALIADLRGGTRPGKQQGAMGYGEIHIALALAQELATTTSISGADALERVLGARLDGKGWGVVARDLGLNVGRVVSRVRSGNERLDAALPGVPASAARVERVRGPERPEKPERPQRPERPERPERGGGRG
jgi:hypothetical protein